MDKDLRDAVDALMRGMTSMEESINKKFEEINKRFDEINDKFDRLEAKVEDLEEAILDMGIIKATVDKHDHDIKRLKRNATM
ncbi:MAG: hypothetical protein PUE12_18550 [Oscillospiraceae bacterium]|nr:hypothetical protein [Oscillospiraceae bacterium]